MAEIIKMPRLSDTMEIGKVVKWYKKIGDKIEEGDIIADIETDKAVQEFEIDTSGILLYKGINEGEKANIDDIIAIIGAENENIDHLLKQQKQREAQEEQKEQQREEQAAQEEQKEQQREEREEREAQEEQEEQEEQKEQEIRIFISPLAKKMIENNKLNISSLSKEKLFNNKRITKIDVENYIKKISTKSSIKNISINHNSIPHSSMRKVISKRLSTSKFTAPHYYITTLINMDKCIYFKNKINDNMYIDYNISYNDIIIKASSLALKKNMKLNSSWFDDKIVYYDDINIGFALSVPDGLLVPVIKNVDKKSLHKISLEIKDKINQAKSHKLKNRDISNSTFTTSNLGMLGIESFTSIINQPNSAILSIGAILHQPIIKNNQIILGHQMKLTLACDHRVIDGVIGSNFLKDLKYLLENPIFILF